jgi:hypothetical protein
LCALGREFVANTQSKNRKIGVSPRCRERHRRLTPVFPDFSATFVTGETLHVGGGPDAGHW